MERTAAEDRSVLRFPAVAPKQKGFREPESCFYSSLRPWVQISFLSRDQLCLCFSACLLPVLVEEEESVHDSAADVPTVSASVEGGKKARGRSEEPCAFPRPSVILALPHTHTHTRARFLPQRASSRAAAPAPPPSPTAALHSHNCLA